MSQIQFTTKQLRTVRTLDFFGQVVPLEMVYHVQSRRAFVVAESAAEINDVFLLVFQQLLSAFEEGETRSVFAPVCFSSVHLFYVDGVGAFVRRAFVAKLTLD